MLRVATRSSPLARWQAEHVVALLQATHPGLRAELVLVESTGDLHRDAPIAELGGQGAFVKEIQQAVLDGRADLAVHSAKDLTSVTVPGLVLAAVPERGDPRDALVGQPLRALARGATVATGSARRRAQLAALRPDVTFVELRGNIGSRLQKVPEGGAVVMAAVALERLRLAHHIAEILEPEVMTPQVAQGALAIETRTGDQATAALVRAVEHRPSRVVVDVERAFLAELGGGCDLPVGAYATLLGGGEVALRCFLAGPGGARTWTASGPAGDPGWARQQARRGLKAVASP